MRRQKICREWKIPFRPSFWYAVGAFAADQMGKASACAAIAQKHDLIRKTRVRRQVPPIIHALSRRKNELHFPSPGAGKKKAGA
jgi:hypothetical protein